MPGHVNTDNLNRLNYKPYAVCSRQNMNPIQEEKMV
jgi:hypothetical protein